MRFSLRRQMTVPGSDNILVGVYRPLEGTLLNYRTIRCNIPGVQFFKIKLHLTILHPHGSIIPWYEGKRIVYNGMVSNRLWTRKFRLCFSIRNVLMDKLWLMYYDLSLTFLRPCSCMIVDCVQSGTGLNTVMPIFCLKIFDRRALKAFTVTSLLKKARIVFL